MRRFRPAAPGAELPTRKTTGFRDPQPGWSSHPDARVVTTSASGCSLRGLAGSRGARPAPCVACVAKDRTASPGRGGMSGGGSGSGRGGGRRRPLGRARAENREYTQPRTTDPIRPRNQKKTATRSRKTGPPSSSPDQPSSIHPRTGHYPARFSCRSSYRLHPSNCRLSNRRERGSRL